MRVSISPGSTLTTRTPVPASSAAHDAPELLQRRLRRAVGAPSSYASVGRRPDVTFDDRSAAAQHHRSGDRLRQPERPDQVHGQRPVRSSQSVSAATAAGPVPACWRC
jgi:hypothetical protein